MSPRGASLRFKLSAVIALMSVVIVCAVTIVRTAMYNRAAATEQRRKAELYAQLLARQLEPAVAFDDSETAREVMNSAGIDGDVERIALYKETGELIQGSTSLPRPWPAPLTGLQTRLGPGAIDAAIPVVSAEGPRGTLLLTLGTSRIETEKRKMWWVTFGVSGALLALSIVAAWVIAGLAARRVISVAHAADRVAGGDLAVAPLEPGAADEIGRLTVGFNVMLDRIRTEQERLAQLVDARTAELLASREQFRRIVETTRAIPFEYRLADERYTYIGPQAAATFGYTPDQFLTPRFMKGLIDPADLPELAAKFAELRMKREYELEFKVTAKDGRRVHLKVVAAADAQYARGVMLDVTEKKQLEEDLQQAQRLESVGRLATGIAHEINTPVQFVNDSVTFVRDAWTDVMGLLAEYREGGALAEREKAIDLEYLQENVPRSTDRAGEGLNRIGEIVKSMKAFAAPEQTDRVSYDVNQGVSNTIIIAKHEYKYVADVEQELGEVPAVLGRPGELNQVLLAVLTNAAQAIDERGERGKITVRTELRGARVVISVRDTGCGIPPEVQPRIFEQFFTTRPVGKGRGLGLSFARAVVTRHGGQISFESTAGAGTTFFISLPAEEPCAEAA